MADCGSCGGALAAWNTSGYCSRTPECRRAIDRQRRPARKNALRLIRPCPGCGGPLAVQNKTGYCLGTPECRRANDRIRRGLPPGNAPCANCGADRVVVKSGALYNYCYRPECRRVFEYQRTHSRRLWMAQVMAASGCADCGCADPRVLQWDHVPGRGPKQFNVSMATHYSLAVLEAEMAKCDVVCANCHKIRTDRRNPGPMTRATWSLTPYASELMADSEQGEAV